VRLVREPCSHRRLCSRARFATAQWLLFVIFGTVLGAASPALFAPYLVKLSNDQVVDETATVTILEPAHTIFRWPNLITDKDFGGWIQERGLYFLDQ
jgi:hypothetical protein